MDHIIQDINELCSKDIYLRFADDKVRLSRAFYHVLVMDGAEVAAALHRLEKSSHLVNKKGISCHCPGLAMKTEPPTFVLRMPPAQ